MLNTPKINYGYFFWLLTFTFQASCENNNLPKKTGYYEIRAEDGKAKIIRYYGANEKIEGASLNFQNQGKLRSFTYLKNDSLINGPSIRFYDDGSLNYMDTFLNGKQEGVSVHYNPRGLLTRKTYYVNGLKDGCEYLFDYDTGDTIKVLIYNQGIVIDSIIKSNIESD